MRLDGQLTFEQVVAGMPQARRSAAGSLLYRLRERGLVQVAEADPFTSQWNADWSRRSAARLARPTR